MSMNIAEYLVSDTDGHPPSVLTTRKFFNWPISVEKSKLYPRAKSEAMRSLHCTNSPRGPPRPAFSANLKPALSESAPM